MRTLVLIVLFVSNFSFAQGKMFCHFFDEKSGKKHFSFVCDEVISYQDGVAIVKHNNQYALLSNSGKVKDKLSLEDAKAKQKDFKSDITYSIIKDKYDESVFHLYKMLYYNNYDTPCTNYEFKPSLETENSYNAELFQYNKLKKEREKAITRIKNASVYDRGLQYTKPRINLLNTLYKELIISLQNEIDFVNSAKEVSKNELITYQTKKLVSKIERAQIDKENLQNEMPYIDSDVKDEVIPTNIIGKVYDDVDLDALKAQIDYLKKEADLLKPEFDAILAKCSKENCSHCNGTGQTVAFSLPVRQTHTEDVWRAQSGVVNTSTGYVEYSYGFSKQTVTTYSSNKIMEKCTICSGSGKNFSYRCIDVNKYASVIAKYYPSLLTEMSKY